MLVGGSGRGLVRPSVSPTVVTRVKVGVVSVSRGEDLSGWGSFTTPAVSVRRREMVWMVGSEEVLGRRARAVHHFWRRRRPGGQRTTAWRGDQVRVAVHLKHQSYHRSSRQGLAWAQQLYLPLSRISGVGLTLTQPHHLIFTVSIISTLLHPLTQIVSGIAVLLDFSQVFNL